MSFETFLEELKASVDAHFSDGTVLEYRKIVKNNGVALTGACLSRPGGEDDSPRKQIVYLDQIYQAMAENPDIPAVTSRLLEVLEAPLPGELAGVSVEEWEDVKDRVILRLIGLERNRERLEKLVHREFLDMAITCCLLFTGSGIGQAVTEISEAIREGWGVSEEEIFSAAMENTARLLPDTLRTLREAAQIPDDDVSENIFVLSNSTLFLGAAALLYTGALKELSERFDSDLFILPTSIHELIVLSADGMTADFLRKAVESVNAADVPPEEVLTDSVYRYVKETGDIVIA